MTPYLKHAKLGHKTSHYSPNGVDQIEECECGRRWLHNPCLGYPVEMQPNNTGRRNMTKHGFRIIIDITYQNAAFYTDAKEPKHDPAPELARILRAYATKIYNAGSPHECDLLDVNGNKCGDVRIKGQAT